MNLGVIRPAKFVFGDYFGVPRHVDAQEKFCRKSKFVARFCMYLGVFRPAKFVYGDYFGVSRHVDAQETILSQNIVCNSVLNARGGFSSCWVRFCGLYRCATTRCCLGDDFFAKHIFLLGFEWTSMLLTVRVRFRRLFRCVSTRWCLGEDYDGNHGL